jgi:hypothetical protein
MEERSRAAAEEIRRRFLEVLSRNGVRLSDPNHWLTETEIAEIIGRHMTAGEEGGVTKTKIHAI